LVLVADTRQSARRTASDRVCRTGVAARGRIIPTCGGDRKCMRIRVIAWTMVPDSVTGVQRETGNGAFSNEEAPNAFSIGAGSAALCAGRAE